MAQDRPQVIWPNGAQCAVMLSFDFDAETMWLSRDPLNARRPALTSQGAYGAKVGVPKILEALRDFEIPATFFVPGWTADNHPDKTEAILRAGHEIGHHGYLHEEPNSLDREAQCMWMERATDVIRRMTGAAPRGFRAPAYQFSRDTLDLLVAGGFLYDASLMGDDVP